jgi:hypothetical protein
MTTEEVMTTEALWQRYAATWSLAAADPATELPGCVTRDVTYCDPNGQSRAGRRCRTTWAPSMPPCPAGPSASAPSCTITTAAWPARRCTGRTAGSFRPAPASACSPTAGDWSSPRRTPNLGEPLAKAAGPVRGLPVRAREVARWLLEACDINEGISSPDSRKSTQIRRREAPLLLHSRHRLLRPHGQARMGHGR